MEKVYIDTEALPRTIFRDDRRKTSKLCLIREVRVSKGQEVRKNTQYFFSFEGNLLEGRVIHWAMETFSFLYPVSCEVVNYFSECLKKYGHVLVLAVMAATMCFYHSVPGTTLAVYMHHFT